GRRHRSGQAVQRVTSGRTFLQHPSGPLWGKSWIGHSATSPQAVWTVATYRELHFMIRKLLSVSVSVAAAAAATLALGAIPASAAGPAATATPNSGLHDLQVISITGSGYNPTSRIQVEECAGTVASP